MSLKPVRGLFLLAAIYDIVLGIVFGLFYVPVYQAYGVELPNHPGYVQLPAMFILSIGIGFLFVCRDPVRNRAVIVLGSLMKLAFSAIGIGYWYVGTIPKIFIPFAIADVVFLFLFLWALGVTRRAVPA